MKAFIPSQNPLTHVLLQVISPPDDTWEVCASIEEAELVIIFNDRAELARLYRADKAFAFLSRRQEKKLPENVIHVDATHVIRDMPKVFAYLKTFKPAPPQAAYRMPDDPVRTVGPYRVLVVDDTRVCLDFAQALLGADHDVVTASGFAEGMEQLNAGRFDYVLSDMQMPCNNYYSSLVPQAYRLGDPPEYGILLAIAATARGCPVAIVTDANHHGNWMSAAIDDMKYASINGQPVLFFNNIGKRWDRALADLVTRATG